MNKSQKREHDQRLINAYNVRIDEIDKQAAKTRNAFEAIILIRSRRVILRKLMNLYDTKKYGLV